MWKKNEESDSTAGYGATSTPQSPASESSAPRAASPARSSSGSPAIIGESIRVQGEIRGSEDLLIEGEVDGQIQLEKHSVTVGRSGRVKADIHGGVLVVEGKVQGNLFAHEQAVVRASGEVRGNITSPRVSLEDGAKFKGSIDMEPRSSSGSSSSSSASSSSSQESRKGDSGGSSSPSSSSSSSSPSSGSGSGKGSGSSGSSASGKDGNDQKQRSGAAAS